MEGSLLDFGTVDVAASFDGVDCTDVPTGFAGLPYAHFSRSTKLGRAADFTNSQRSNRGGGANPELDHDADNEREFSAVDHGTRTTRSQFGRRKFVQNRRNIRTKSRDPYMQKLFQRYQNEGNLNKRKRKLKRKPFHRRNNWNQMPLTPSVDVTDAFEQVGHIDISSAQIADGVGSVAVEDFKWCGPVHEYNKKFDRASVKDPIKLRKSDVSSFSHVTARADPVLQSAMEAGADVIATDTVLCRLMTAPRSALPWDFVVLRRNGKFIIDKRPGSSQLDFLSVHETGTTPLRSTDEADPNSKSNLSLEATEINHNFRQQVLRATAPEEHEAHPFSSAEDAETPAGTSFRYRIFTLGGTRIAVRTEVHGYRAYAATAGAGGVDRRPVSTFAMNEWDHKQAGMPSYKSVSQSGKLKLELKNNANKIAQWAAKAYLAGTHAIQIGYLTRKIPGSRDSHSILGVESERVPTLMKGIALYANQMWWYVDTVLQKVREVCGEEDATFVVLRDPNDAILRIFKVPVDFFADVEEDDE